MVYLVIPGKVMMIINLVRSIAFDTVKFLGSTYKDGVFLLPTVLTLKDTGIYICFPNCYMAFYIKASVDQRFSRSITLQVPYINPNNRHV